MFNIFWRDNYIRLTLVLTVVIMGVQGIVNSAASVDTIKASTPVEIALPEILFDRVHTTTIDNQREKVLVKWTTRDEENEPRATYYPSDQRLLVEVSLPKLLTGTNHHQLTQTQLDQALTLLDQWLAEKFKGCITSVRTMYVQRVDFVTHWDVGDDLPLYLDELEKLSLPSHRTEIFETGVRFKSGSRHITFYDKYAESGNPESSGYLRYEISTRRAGIRYMCQSWLKCGRTITDLVQVKHAHTMLNRFANNLHLDTATNVPLDDEILREHFGRRWASAKTYAEVIRNHGANSWKRQMIGKSTYYRYKAEFAAIPESQEYLLPLLIGAA